MKESYDRSVEMICSVCGGKTFSYDNKVEDGEVTCVQCKKVYTRTELSDANQENISVNLEEVKMEVIEDIKKDFKNIFKNNKRFRIK
jgi:uncharacterized Zn finger protein (UPF0148 family)